MAPKGRHAHVLLPNANALSATPAMGWEDDGRVSGGSRVVTVDGRVDRAPRGSGGERAWEEDGTRSIASRGWDARVETGARETRGRCDARGRDGFARGFGRTRDEAVHVLQRGARDELEPGAQRQGGEEREGEEHGTRREAGGAGEGPDHRFLPLGHVRVGEIGHRRHGGALWWNSLGAGHCAASPEGCRERASSRSHAPSFRNFFRLIFCDSRIWTNHGRPFPRRSPPRVSSAKESHSAARSHPMSAVSAAASFAGVAVRAAVPGRRANDRAARLVVSASDKFARTSIDLSKRCVPRLGARTRTTTRDERDSPRPASRVPRRGRSSVSAPTRP